MWGGVVYNGGECGAVKSFFVLKNKTNNLSDFKHSHAAVVGGWMGGGQLGPETSLI